MTGLVTHTDYARPYRPWPVALFNRLGGPGAPRRFDAGALISAARRTTGLTELSDAPLLEPLTRYCEALNTEARLSPFGRIVQRERLKGLLINRLRMDDLMRRRPDLLDQPDPDCLIIAGLARTGTTFLQRILAADPYARSLPAWEALNPAPFPGEVSGRPDARRRKGRQASGFVRWLAPDFRAVHPVEPGAPEEDILLLDLTLMSQTAEAVTHVPSYSKWLEAQDHQPTYRYLRDVLKILNGLQPGTHWILKTPNHAEHLDCILDVFPKATVLVTHRDPLATMPSCCSLMAHAQALSSDDIDPHAIGTHWLRKSVLMARRTVEARAAHPGRKALDIMYEDMLGNPAAIIEQIYSLHGSPLTPEGAAAVKAAAAVSGRASHGHKRHAYRLDDFGLSPDMVLSAFAPFAESRPHPTGKCTE